MVIHSFHSECEESKFSKRMKCMIENLGAPGSLHIIQKRVKYLYILMVSQVVMKLRNYMHQLL